MGQGSQLNGRAHPLHEEGSILGIAHEQAAGDGNGHHHLQNMENNAALSI